ncbi:MAG: hypothetical protein ACXAD7_06215 [Candidatus Kariarchaeaceae archaeon]|jgi:DNA-binding MarR family transcriptional regulator
MTAEASNSSTSDYLGKLGLTEDELESKYEQLQKHGIGFGVVIAIRLYEALNLKSIARLIGAAENTTLHQVKKLLKDGFIEIDPIATATGRGKYYKITDLSNAIFRYAGEKYESEEVRNEMQEAKKKGLDKILIEAGKRLKEGKYQEIPTQVKMASNINSFIEKIAIQEVDDLIQELSGVENEEEILEKIKKSNIAIGTFNLHTSNSPSANFDQMIRYEELLYEFNLDLMKLKKEFEEENKSKKATNQHFYYFTAPVNRNVFED